MNERFDYWFEKFQELPTSDLIEIVNEYSLENRDDCAYVWDFDDEFFDMNFATKIDAASAVHFGKVNWSDEYVRLDGYRNVVSLSVPAVIRHVMDYAKEIYEMDITGRYIDMDEYDYPEEEEEDDE